MIVNTTNASLKLDSGILSNTVYNSAGVEIGSECKNNYPNGLEMNSIAVTSAGRIVGTKCIFHITLPIFIKDQTSSVQSSIKKCLNELVKKNFNSIAFPSIGTGGFGFPADHVAESSFNAIYEFLSQNEQVVLRVNLVIYEKDANIEKVKNDLIIKDILKANIFSVKRLNRHL